MSKIARWTYTNTATVKPFLAKDKYGGVTYGEPYPIKCTWTANGTQGQGVRSATTPMGLQFVVKHMIYCEDARPKYLDMVQLNGHAEWEEIKSHTEWDMSPFKDSPDYLCITG